jgi:hypothetical protein
MILLKQPLGTIKYERDSAEVFAGLLSRLDALGLSVQRVDRSKGEIVAACVGKCFDMILWRCYSDRLLLEIIETGRRETTVEVSALPNFLMRVPKSDESRDLSSVVAALRAMDMGTSQPSMSDQPLES